MKSILLGRVLGNEAHPLLGSQPAGDSMHSHEPGGGLPPPPTRPTATHTCINPVVRRHYFPSCSQLPSQPSGITALRVVPSYTAWWQRHIGVRNLPRVFTPWWAETGTRDLLIASPTLCWQRHDASSRWYYIKVIYSTWCKTTVHGVQICWKWNQLGRKW